MYNSERPSQEELPSTSKLLASTCLALVVAGVLLITAVLPAEYGVDPTGVGEILGLKEMGEIKSQLALEAEMDQQPEEPIAIFEPEPSVVAPAVKSPAEKAPAPASAVTQKDQRVVKLKPGEAAEIKLVMEKDAVVNFSWQSSGKINVDTHADTQGIRYHGYSKARQIDGEQGELVAAFTGKHGWFWRNRTQSTVTVTLTTEGEYSSVVRVL